MTDRARAWIRALALQPHPEGGHFRETYRSAERLPAAALPSRFGGKRSVSTAIYFLLRGGECSRLHRIRSDEVWHYYAGSPLTVHVIDVQGRYRALRLGRTPSAGQLLQVVVPAGAWFGATVDRARGYALVGCTVAPGFDFADFELADRTTLLRQFPRHRRIIERLTPAWTARQNPCSSQPDSAWPSDAGGRDTGTSHIP